MSVGSTPTRATDDPLSETPEKSAFSREKPQFESVVIKSIEGDGLSIRVSGHERSRHEEAVTVRIDEARGGLPLAAATRVPHLRIVGLQSVGPTSASMRQGPSWPRAVLNAASSSPGCRRAEGARAKTTGGFSATRLTRRPGPAAPRWLSTVIGSSANRRTRKPHQLERRGLDRDRTNGRGCRP